MNSLGLQCPRSPTECFDHQFRHDDGMFPLKKKVKKETGKTMNNVN